MRNIIKTGALLVLLYMFSACKSNPTTQVIYTGSGIPGTILGKVILYDTLYDNLGYVILDDASGVTVSVEGATLKAITDKDGKYSIPDVPPGTYLIAFSKDGFATDKLHLSFAGNGTESKSDELIRISFISPTLVLRAFDTNGIATFTFGVLDTISGNAVNSIRGDVFFGRSENISPLDPNSYVVDLSANGSGFLNKTGNFQVNKSSLLKAGFSTGEKIYCVLYAGKVTVNYYSDYNSFKNIFTSFSPYTSIVKSFILPP